MVVPGAPLAQRAGPARRGSPLPLLAATMDRSDHRWVSCPLHPISHPQSTLGAPVATPGPSQAFRAPRMTVRHKFPPFFGWTPLPFVLTVLPLFTGPTPHMHPLSGGFLSSDRFQSQDRGRERCGPILIWGSWGEASAQSLLAPAGGSGALLHLVSSCPPSFPALEPFPMSQFFASGGQSIGCEARMCIGAGGGRG